MTLETRALSNPAVLSHEALGVDLAAEIAGKQQAITPATPIIPAPELPTQLEEIVVKGNRIEPVSATAPMALTTGQMIQEQVTKTDALASQLAGQLETDLGLRAEESKVTSNAILTIAEADKKIQLQKDVEANRIEDQLINVSAEETSEENQARLLDKYTGEMAEYQAALDERQQEAEAGGFGYLLKSMLNMEIYGTPGGRKDIAINSMASEAQATMSEIQGITTAVTNFETANKATQNLITTTTIHANQQRITALAQRDLSEARQAMLKDNAEGMQMLMGLNNSRLAGLNSLLNYQNSVEAREDRRLNRIFRHEQFGSTKLIREAQLIGIQLDNDQKTLRNLIDANADIGLIAQTRQKVAAGTEQLNALVRQNQEQDATSTSRIAVIQGQRQVQEAQLATMVWDLENKKDLAPLAKEQMQENITATRARIVKLDRDNRIEEQLAPFRLKQAEQQEKVMDQQIRLNELSILIAEGTVQEKLDAVREKALLEAQIAEDTRVSTEAGAVSIGLAQEALYGFKEDIEVRRVGVNTTGPAGTKYDLLENIGTGMASGAGLQLGDTTYKSWLMYNALTADGSQMRDIPSIVALQEVNENLELRYAMKPGEEGGLVRPTDPAEAAAHFNTEADKYIATHAANVDYKDQSNPVSLDPLSILEKKAPGLLEDPLYKIIRATGQEEANPERMVDIALGTIGKEGGVTIEEASAGLTAIYNSGKFNSEHFQYGLGAAGFNTPGGLNIRLPKPGSVMPALGLMGASPSFAKLATEKAFPGASDAALEGAQTIKTATGKLVTINAMDQTQWMAYLIARMTSIRIKGVPTSTEPVVPTAPAPAGDK